MPYLVCILDSSTREYYGVGPTVWISTTLVGYTNTDSYVQIHVDSTWDSSAVDLSIPVEVHIFYIIMHT